jgi:Tat protein secretion system quality control protein TatD with DNase activity
LELYADSVKEIAMEIIVEGISENPIFIAHQHTVSIGEVILDRKELNTEWTIQASTFEEFVEKGIITPEKKALFLKSYKKPEDYMCVFVIVPEGANFIYYPYKIKK